MADPDHTGPAPGSRAEDPLEHTSGGDCGGAEAPGGDRLPPYTPPRLTDYGEVTRLTRGVLAGSADGSMGLL